MVSFVLILSVTPASFVDMYRYFSLLTTVLLCPPVSPQTPNEIHESYLVIYVLSDLVPKKEVLSKFGKPLQHCSSGVPMKPISSTDN